jgi:hypothetical protein
VDASPGAGTGGGRQVVLVVDAANVVGARPDGWWRDRAGAARRLLAGLERLPGATVEDPAGVPVVVAAVGVVLEGRARQAVPTGAADPAGVRVLLAPGSGDDALVDLVEELGDVLDDGEVVLVTADRGLRARVAVRSWGPGWLRALTDDHGGDAEGGRSGE